MDCVRSVSKFFRPIATSNFARTQIVVLELIRFFNMKSNEYFFMGLALGLVAGFICGLIIMDMGAKTQAITNNAAEYQVNKTTGEVKFVWLTTPTK